MEHIKFLDELEIRTNDLKSTIKKYRDSVYKAKNPQVIHLLLATLMLMAEQNVIFLLRQITEIKEVIKKPPVSADGKCGKNRINNITG